MRYQVGVNMKEIHDNITFIVAIIFFSAPLSLVLVLGESVIKWWWLLVYYIVFIGSSFALMRIKYRILQDMGRDIEKVFLIFGLSGTSKTTVIIFIFLFTIRDVGSGIPGSVWASFYVFAFVNGYQKFKKREKTYVMFKKQFEFNPYIKDDVKNKK